MTPAAVRAAAVAGGLLAVLVPGRALADAAGPTEFRSEIVAVTPATPSIELSIEGGDSFVRIAVAPGTEVVVLGYDEEPATWIDAQGEVYENVRSFATYYNDDRYGGTDIPDIVDNDAPPEWERVGGGGEWAWHDHRAHWMGAEPPLNMRPGESLAPQVIPLLVDGREVSVAVVSTLVADPSPWHAVAGGVLGVGIAAVAITRRATPLAALVLAAAALAIGATQFLSLPSETGPRPIWWLAPAIAVVSATASWWWRRTAWLRDGLVALATAQLLVWVFVRWSTLTKPVLPTDAPFWLDRGVTAAAAAGGVALLAAALVSMVLAGQPPKAASIAASSPS